MQSPKLILVHVDSSSQTPERIRVACRLAETFKAEVVALPCVTPALMRYPLALEGSAGAIAIMQDCDKDFRHKAYNNFLTASAGSSRIRWQEPLAGSPSGFKREALYADLIVLGQRDPEGPESGELPADFVPALLIESGKPALILPFTGPVWPLGQNVLVAWKETREAARAVSAALPWLREATTVHVVCQGPEAHTAIAALQKYLKSEGITAVPHQSSMEDRDAGGDLLSLSADLGADLLVMGCYGHSRSREWALGGASTQILKSMTLPVLMVH